MILAQKEAAGVPARRAALRLLHAVLDRGQALETALEGALSGLDQPSDRALARAIASTVLRWQTDLDRLIDSATAKPLPPDARARMVLRMALVQAILMQTPSHAVIGTALPLVEGGPRRLVHGVLSRLLREGARLPERPTIPAPYAERWTAHYGAEATQAAADALGHEPPTDFTLRNPEETATVAERLGGVSLLPGHVRVNRKGALSILPGFEEGGWWVQDLAASIPARLLGARPGDKVIDLCAAPGGKTLQLAAAGAEVTAVDIAEKRLRRLRENLERMRLQASVVTADARKWSPEGPVDHILLDAPCSASGIFRRHPDVLHLKGARDLTPLLALQRDLADRAAGWLPVGGRLVYCVCSLEPEEGEAQVEALLARHQNLGIEPILQEELPAGLAPDPRGWLRTLPGDLAQAGGLDGFFIARLVRHA